jgi:hypothetical protein
MPNGMMSHKGACTDTDPHLDHNGSVFGMVVAECAQEGAASHGGLVHELAPAVARDLRLLLLIAGCSWKVKVVAHHVMAAGGEV